jgi:hypothetical protein
VTGLCGGFDHGDAVLRGYVTIDVVERCEPVFPSDPGYFARGENRVASDDNALLVDYFLVSAGGGFAQGEQAVHIRADAAAFEPGDYTFYGRFVGGDGSDARQPLGRQFSTRYFAAGTAFDGATSLLVWRDPKSASAVALPCGTTPPWYPLPNGVDRLFDEEENVVILEPQGAPHQMPLATQRLVIGGLALPTPFPVGWTVVSLDHGGGDLYGDRAQGWVSAVLEATGGAFSVGFHGGILQSACGPDTIPRMSAEPVVE